jgi:hypothetical protein
MPSIPPSSPIVIGGIDTHKDLHVAAVIVPRARSARRSRAKETTAPRDGRHDKPRAIRRVGRQACLGARSSEWLGTDSPCPAASLPRRARCDINNGLWLGLGARMMQPWRGPGCKPEQRRR